MRIQIWNAVLALKDLQRINTVKAVGLFVVLSFLLSWLSFSFEPVLLLFNEWWVRLFNDADLTSLSDPAWSIAIIPPLILTALFLWWLGRRYKEAIIKRLPDPDLAIDAPTPHQGLIVMLSLLSLRDRDVLTKDDPLRVFLEAENKRRFEKKKPEERREHTRLMGAALLEWIKEHKQERSLVRKVIFGTTLGPLWAAAELHRSVLRHCLVVTTDDSGVAYDLSCEIVRQAANKPQLDCREKRITDPYNMEGTFQTFKEVYNEIQAGIPGWDLDETQVIADFTGGTAQMTAGMVLATLDDDRHIQYLRQDKSLLREDLSPLTDTEIAFGGVIMEVKTSTQLIK